MIVCYMGTGFNRKPYNFTDDTTLKAALESQGIDYGTQMVNLNGTTMSPSDLEKTFAEHGVTDKCYLLSVVKADNAAKVNVFGGMMVVESTMTMDNIKRLEKYNPDALKVFTGEGKEKEVVFQVVSCANRDGHINSIGAEFGSDSPTTGKAIINIKVPECADTREKITAWATETIGTSAIRLGKVEAGIEAALAEVQAQQDAIAACINIL